MKENKSRPNTAEEFLEEIKSTASRLQDDGISRGDAKLLSTALKELRYCFQVFSRYQNKKKVSIFGSARTPPEHPTYVQAMEFGRKCAEQDWMVITGAGVGIMEAGHLGAGPEMSIGLNILLPFEQSANTVMTGNDKLMTMRYFFTRKLMFIKESHAIVLFPGGFGTHDEGFEALTLIQTGKSHLIPIVMVDQPGGTYWKDWEEFIVNELLGNQLISPADVHLYHITESVDHAVEVVTRFYQNYHSYRYVNHYLMIRLLKPLHPAAIEKLNLEFQDILVDGQIVPAEADPLEASDPELMHLPRLKLHFDRKQHGRLRMLFDEINNSPTL